MGKIRRLAALSMSDRRLLAIASIRLAMVALALRWFGFRWIADRMPIARRSGGDPDVHRWAVRYATWIEVAARYLPIQTRCLARSIALHWWLRSEGTDSQLRIGVAKRGRELTAHAWVEVAGVPVNGTMAELAPFTPLEPVGAQRLEAQGRVGGPMATPGSQIVELQHHLTATGHRQ
jgi:hypothetical protein